MTTVQVSYWDKLSVSVVPHSVEQHDEVYI